MIGNLWCNHCGFVKFDDNESSNDDNKNKTITNKYWVLMYDKYCSECFAFINKKFL